MPKFVEGQRIRVISDSPEVFDTEGSEWLIGEVGTFYKYEDKEEEEVEGMCWVVVDGAPFPMMSWDIEAAPTPEEVGQERLPLAGEETRR